MLRLLPWSCQLLQSRPEKNLENRPKPFEWRWFLIKWCLFPFSSHPTTVSKYSVNSCNPIAISLLRFVDATIANWDPNINCSKNSCQKSRTGTNQLEAGKEVWSQIIPTQLVICFICTAPSQALLGFTAATPATRAAAMVRTYDFSTWMLSILCASP